MQCKSWLLVAAVYFLVLLGDGGWHPAAAAEGNQPAVASQPSPALDSVRTPDGSLNILALKTTGGLHLSGMASHDDWRSRYAASLPPLTQAQRHRILVAPSYDATTSGVGSFAVSVYRPLLEGLIASRTEAELLGVVAAEVRPQTLLNDLPVPWDQARSEWIKAARRSSAHQDADVICTVIDDIPSGSRLRILWVDCATGTEHVLASGIEPRWNLSPRSMARQREVVQSAVQALLDRKLLPPLPPPGTVKLDLDEELRETLALLNAPDCFAVMDGIDRALLLARLFPMDSLPLQAAAYGYQTLSQSALDYAWMTNQGWKSLLTQLSYDNRMVALLQLALMRQEQAKLPHLVLLAYEPVYGEHFQRRIGEIVGGDDAHRPLEFLPTIAWLKNDAVPADLPALDERMPMWLRARSFACKRRNEASGPWQDAVVKFADQWSQYDQALMPVFWMKMEPSFPTGNIFGTMRGAARVAYRLGIASEAAVIVTQDAGSSATQALLAIWKAAYPEFRGVAPGASFAQAREQFLAVLNRREDAGVSSRRFADGKDFLGWLEPLNKGAAPLLAGEEAENAKAVWPGFQFTGSERILFARRRTEWAPVIMSVVNTVYWGEVNATRDHATAFRDARPECFGHEAEYLLRFATFIPSYPGFRPELQNRLRAFAARQPLDMALQLLYIRAIAAADDAATRDGLRVLKRKYPYRPWVDVEIGDIQAELGNHAAAADYYKRAFERMPKRFDIGIRYAWEQCRLGNDKDPALRQLFGIPPRAVVGNTQFHDDNLNYLVYWAKDYKAAREAAEFLKPFTRDGHAENWLFEIAVRSGDTTQALELLRARPLPTERGPRLANALIGMADDLHRLGRDDEAKAKIQEAASVEFWAQRVLMACAESSLRTSDTQRAREFFKLAIERYGSNPSALEGLCQCLEIEGKTTEALTLLENEYRKNPAARGASIIGRLACLYGKAAKPEVQRALIGDYLVYHGRTRSGIVDLADFINDPKLSEMLTQNLNELMHHTHTRDELAPIWRRYGFVPPAPYLDEPSGKLLI